MHYVKKKDHTKILWLFGTLHNCIIYFIYFLDLNIFLIKIKLKIFLKNYRSNRYLCKYPSDIRLIPNSVIFKYELQLIILIYNSKPVRNS